MFKQLNTLIHDQVCCITWKLMCCITWKLIDELVLLIFCFCDDVCDLISCACDLSLLYVMADVM